MIRSTIFALCFAVVASAQSNCKTVSFVVSGTAQNRNISGSPPLSSVMALQSWFLSAPLVTVSGPQTIAATYCTPTVVNGNGKKLQVLSGSITADRGGWNALGGTGTDFPSYKPELYSWTKFANAQGYPTLAIDRLGTGKSSHPNALVVAQAAYEQALYNDLARQLRAGGTLPCSYSYLIYVGNSYGSQLGIGIAGTYQKAYDEFVLTGVTNSVQKGFVGVLLVDAEPAQTVDPARFGTLPPGYLTTASQVGRTNSFFGSKAQVSFEDTVAQLFFDRKDVVSVGQFASVYAFPFNGAGFTGRVLVLDGEEDQPFCGPGSPVIGPANCGSQLQQTGSLFPNAKYNWKSVDKIGHAVQVHTRSLTLFSVAHSFLAGTSFQGGTPA